MRQHYNELAQEERLYKDSQEVEDDQIEEEIEDE